MLYHGIRIDPNAQQIMSAMKKDGEEEYGENEYSESDLTNDDDATYVVLILNQGFSLHCK